MKSLCRLKNPWHTWWNFKILGYILIIDLRVRLEQGERRQALLSLAGPTSVEIGEVKLFALLCAKAVNDGRLWTTVLNI